MKLLSILCFFTFIFSQCEYDIGDTNDDNILNVIDIIYIINVIISEEQEFDQNIDLDFNQIINISDIIVLVNRIIDDSVNITSINNISFDFNELNVSWIKSLDYGFDKYQLYYSDILNDNNIIIYTTSTIHDTSVVLNNIILSEQNWFSVSVTDFMGCELISEEIYYELPFKEYETDNLGNVIDAIFNHEDFSSAQNCQGCHEQHYNEWSESMHSYTMHSPIFFSYRNQTIEEHPDVGEMFCIQCHNPIAYLTNTSFDQFLTVEEFQNSDLPNVIKEGISCDVCHTATNVTQTVFTNNTGSASALYKLFPGENIKFGPIENPEENNYHDSYYLPTYESSQMCLPCHDLVIRDVEAEITFTEWDRIPGFSMFGGVSCQECHMPEKEDGTHDHSFIGVDIDLAIPLIDNPLYDKVNEMLNSAVIMEFDIWNTILPDTINSNDSLLIPLTIESLTAHSIPTGTSFNREVWVEIIVSKEDSLIYTSGYIENNIQELNYSDDNLLIFKSYLLDENNDTTQSVIDAYDIINNSLPAYSQRFSYYNVFIPNYISGNIEVSARMLFRPFDPQFINQHNQEFIENLPVYEMFSINKQIYVQ